MENIRLSIRKPIRIDSQKLSPALSIFITCPDSQNFKSKQIEIHHHTIISALTLEA